MRHAAPLSAALLPVQLLLKASQCQDPCTLVGNPEEFLAQTWSCGRQA